MFMVILIFGCYLIVFIEKATSIDECFHKIVGKEINQTSQNMIELTTTNKIACLLKCRSISECMIVRHSMTSNECRLFRATINNLLIDSAATSQEIFIKKIELDKGLVAYWPFKPNDLRDYVSLNEMQYCESVSFETDRFGISSSAVYFNYGFCQVQSGVYFDGSDFTVSAWVKVIDFGFWSRIFDFGNGVQSDNILFVITESYSQHPVIGIYSSSYCNEISSQSILNYNKWQYVAGVFNQTHLLIYVDGVLGNSMLVDTKPKNILRTSCFIGKSNWANNDYLKAIMDDVKIYNRALNQIEILQDMNEIFV